MYKYIIIFFICLISCKTNKTESSITKCKNNLTISYDKPSQVDIDSNMVDDSSQKKITVFFEDNFNDNIEAFINGKRLFKEFVETDESLGTTEKKFSYNYSEDKKVPLLMVNLLNKNNCFELEIKEEYNLMYVYYYEQKWEVIFSNVYSTYE